MRTCCWLRARARDAYLNPDVIGHFVVVLELLAECEVRFRSGRIRHFNLLEANLNEMSEKAQLLLVGHG